MALNSQNAPDCTALEHQLALEKLKNEHLQQQVRDQKQLIENYQEQITQLNKTLEKANTSIQDFVQVRMLEFKQAEIGHESPLEQEKERKNKRLNRGTSSKEKKMVDVLRKRLNGSYTESGMGSTFIKTLA